MLNFIRSHKKITIVIGVVLAVVLVVPIALSVANPANAAPMNQLTLKKGDIAETLLLSGTIKSDSVSYVYAPSSMKVQKVNVQPGDVVKEGDVLATLDTSSLLLDIRQAELNMQNATQSLINQELELDNSQGSAERSVASAKLERDTTYKTYRDVTDQTSAAVRTAEIELEAAQRKYDDAVAVSANTPSVQSAQADLQSAQQKVNQLNGFDYTVENARISMENARLNYQKALNNTNTGTTTTAQTTPEAAFLSYQQAQNSYNQAIETHRTNLDSANIALEKARVNYDNAVKTANDNITTLEESLRRAQVSLDNALKNQTDSVTNAKNAYERARNSYSSAQASNEYAESKTIATAEISIELQKVALEKLNKQLNDATIKATSDGTITFKNATIGQNASGLMFVIENTQDLVVETTVGETEIGRLAVGQSAAIRTDGTSDERFPAEVSFVSAAAVKQADGQTSSSTNVQFSIKIRVLQPDPRVKIGMNARLSLTLNERQQVFAVPIEAVAQGASGPEVYVIEGTQTRAIPVTLGLENDTHIEIISDELTEGMSIQADAIATAPARTGFGITAGVSQ